jgi:hypothetical protein
VGRERQLLLGEPEQMRGASRVPQRQDGQMTVILDVLSCFTGST